VDQEPGSGFPIPRQLPRNITHFIGRDAELAQLDALLGSTETHTMVISAIAGAAGIGKTSLALRWANLSQDRFPDGQLYVNLRGYDADPPLSPNHALEGFLRGLGLPPERIPEDVEVKASLYRSLLAGRRMLVVLDNAVTPDQVRPLLPNEPACRVLVTSRSRLSGLVARDGAHRISVDCLTPSEAISLLTEVIGRRAAQEPEAIAELARRCDYLPLALRVAAERVAGRVHHTITEMVDDLASEHLDALTSDDELSAVRTVFGWSYRALPNETARVFRLLGLHPGTSISTEAVAALAGTTLIQKSLDALVNVHLLTETSKARYQFHDLLRAYAIEVAAEEPNDERKEAIQRLYDWYLHTAHAGLYAYYPQHPEIPIAPCPPACRPLTFTNHDEARAWFIAEHTNLMTLIRHAPEVGQYTAGWQLPNAVDCYFTSEQPVSDLITIHQLGLAAAQHVGDRLGERWAYGHLDEALQTLNRYDEAIACAEKGLKIAKEIGYLFGEAASLGAISNCYNELGRYAEAQSYSRLALNIFRKIGQRRNEGLSLTYLGIALHGMGHLDEALLHIRQGLDIYIAIGAVNMQGVAMRCSARIYFSQGLRHDAIDAMRRAGLLFRKTHSEHGYAETLSDLGEMLDEMGESEQAREVWTEALSILTYLDPTQAERVRTLLEAQRELGGSSAGKDAV
jgi:tetratricopeptide (TPR) repeat protein